ncbi:MAG: hypothetical protein N3E45_01440 [Oscillatoriaceae bacterium SKW80]|nr:hypothetical protein [Oscillatoriaceae bacterium SKYG93]MCX8119492.1 hypothetical protein [Oscillatoriaceae bacterium SKW80]MDW8454959.1 hypothetical protein [Oscillatoriaceae cyanobacterium SKYGB_i_bin93]HIK28262.1 hypothetical protein [Oscillatoriaceae cyanobacterium M7585_C2015_266]
MVNLFLAVIFWLIAIALAVGNYFIADLFIVPEYGEYTSHVYQSVVLIVVFFILSWIYARQTRGSTWASTVLGTSFLWLGLSVIFDLVIKRYVICGAIEKSITNVVVLQDKITKCMMSDYAIWEGRLLILVLACAFVAPLLMGTRVNR